MKSFKKFSGCASNLNKFSEQIPVCLSEAGQGIHRKAYFSDYLNKNKGVKKLKLPKPRAAVPKTGW